MEIFEANITEIKGSKDESTLEQLQIQGLLTVRNLPRLTRSLGV